MITYNIDPRLVKLLDLMKSRVDWKKVITGAPYFVKIKEKGDYILLKYDMYNSDLENDIVQACRGIIFKDKKVVCQSFYKFFNQGEKKFTADDNVEGIKLGYKIDYSKEHEIQEKLDGSMLRLWYDSGWHVSTSGMIDAADAEIQGMSKSYGDLFWETLEKYYPNREVLDMLNKNWCYTFELVSPEAKLVVQYNENKLYLLNAFDLTTYQELNPREIEILRYLKFDTPRIYPESFLQSIDSIDNFEGCVITQVDDNGVLQRVKLKSEKYREMFKLRGNSGSDKELFKAIVDGSIDDKIAAFPEYGPRAEQIKQWLREKIEALDLVINSCHYDLDRKTFAELYKNNKNIAHCWKKYDDKNYCAEDFFLDKNNFNKVWDMYRGENE